MKDNFEHNSLIGVKFPKLCYTAGGMLIHRNKVLLVKHKKLGVWLNPGGHIDENELPHQAAEREFFEETGVKVRAIDAIDILTKKLGLADKHDKLMAGLGFSSASVLEDSLSDPLGFKPNPISTNIHWVNKESYDLRIKSKNPDLRYPTRIWKRGCEQHVGFLYLLEPTGSVEFSQNIEETDGIAWFGSHEISQLKTLDNVRDEIALGFAIIQGVE